MSVKLEDGIEFSQADFGISFLDRVDIWSRALNRVFEDLELPVEAKIERYIDDCDYLKEKDRIRITVKRTQEPLETRGAEMVSTWWIEIKNSMRRRYKLR